MNKEHIIGIAGNIFGALETVSEDVYKGILKVNAKDAGVYYIDLTEKLADDFDAYQEKILAKEYYNTPGSLQWNYYFLLLQDQVAKETKTKIENNDKYARKYVFNEEEFQDFFNLEKSSGDLDSNIIIEWKQALDKAGLQEIYSDAKQVDVISRFESNTAKKTKAEKNTAAKSATDDMIKSVSRLTLKPDYRKYPVSERNFNFGKVNLIKGINGVGKTSLFEAIELIICGRSFRNPALKEKNNCIEAVFNNSGTVVKYDGTSTEPYRDRDLKWYSSSYTRDNYLYISFNRYNFFNADDGRRFSSSNSDEEVKLALFNIVLGPEYDYIAGRMQKIYDKLRLTHNKISAEVKKAKSDIESADKIIKKYKNSDALKAMQKAVSRNIAELQFLKKELNPENDHTEIEEINNNIAAICSAILEQKNVGNLKDLDGLIEDFKRKDAIFKNFHDNLSGLSEKIQTDRQKESAFKADNLLIENALKYFADERFFSLERLESNLKDQIAEINKVEFLVEIFKELDPGSYHSEKTIEAIVAANVISAEEYNREVKEIEKNQRDYLDKFSKVEQLVQELKTLGTQFLKLNTDTGSCPLCETDFDRAELERRINELPVLSSAASDPLFTNGNKRLEELRVLIAKVDSFSRYLVAVQSACKTIGYEYSSVSLDDVIIKINEVMTTLPELRKKLEADLSLKKYADSSGVSGQEFTALKNSLAARFGDHLTFIYTGKNAFETQLKEIAAGQETLKKSLAAHDESIATISLKFKNDFGLSSESSYTAGQVKNMLNEEEQKINILNDCFDKLKSHIAITETSSVHDISLASAILTRNIESLKSELRNQFELDAGLKLKAEAEGILAKNEGTGKPAQRYKLACETLESLLNKGGNDQLNEFLKINLKEITDIFRTIHTPREFVDIILEGETLFLITELKEPRKITQISTGQRSALALSIFITLNRKLKHGPNIIMFDDPVSFIDDLNALSFLDFLRLFVLKENKQIFFATANARLGNLFEKKFNFLGEQDFKKWELKR